MFRQIWRGMDRLYFKLGLTRYLRIEKYIKLLEEKFVVKNEHDREVVLELNNLIEDTLKAVKALAVVSTISYIGLYFSVISAFFSSSKVISTVLSDTIGMLVGFFGTTLFLVLMFFSNRLSELYYQDLNLMMSHLITIYSKNKMKDEFLFDGQNSYLSFIKFFKELK